MSPSPGPSLPLASSLPSASTTPTPTSRAPRVGPAVPTELEPAQVARHQAASGALASTPSSPFPPSSLSPIAPSPPARPVPKHLQDLGQAPPTATTGCTSSSNRQLTPASSPSTSTSLSHLELPASPAASTSSHNNDPVTSLGGRRTPFFMLAPHDEWAVREREEQEWLERAAAAAGEGGDGSGGRGGPALRFYGGGAGSGGGGRHGSATPQVGVEERSWAPGRPGCQLDDARLGHEGAEVHPLENLVRALVSRIDELETFSVDLSHRLQLLETAAPPFMVRGGPQPTFVPRPTALPPRFAPGIPPTMPPYPSPFSHTLLDGRYPAAEPHQRRISPNGDEFTPPASPQVHPHGRPAISRSSSLTSSASHAPLGRPSSLERGGSFGSLHFSPLEGQGLGRPGSAFSSPLSHGPTASATSTSSAMGGWGMGGTRERSVSLAERPSGERSVREGGGVDDRAEQTTLHHRSISLGTPFYPRRPPLQRQLPIPSYRDLLDTDADIDTEGYVRRILAHSDQQCSLFLQQRVRSTTQEKRQELFDAVGRHVLELSLSKFGNFLVSRCFEAGDSALTQAFEDALTGHFLQLSLDSFGCHVVQKLLDCGGPTSKDKVITELLPHPHVLTTKSSVHVLNRILTTPNSPAFFERLANLGTGQWASIVKEDGGSLVVQHMLEDWAPAASSVVAREILDALDEVSRTPSGSLIVTNLLDRNSLPFCTKTLQVAPDLALDPFGAKVVDKCMRSSRAGPAGIGAFVQAITTSSGDEPPPFVGIASHAQGAQLLVNLLSGHAAPDRDKDTLGRTALEQEGALLSTGGAHGARLVGLCRTALVG